MAEYIERDYAIREACREICGCEPNECEFDKPCAIVERYKNWPAADVRENVKAKVIVDKNDNEICSNCGCHLLTMYTVHDALVLQPNFCPNCGAKMEVQDGE